MRQRTQVVEQAEAVQKGLDAYAVASALHQIERGRPSQVGYFMMRDLEREGLVDASKPPGIQITDKGLDFLKSVNARLAEAGVPALGGATAGLIPGGRLYSSSPAGANEAAEERAREIREVMKRTAPVAVSGSVQQRLEAAAEAGIEHERRKHTRRDRQLRRLGKLSLKMAKTLSEAVEDGKPEHVSNVAASAAIVLRGLATELEDASGG